MQTKLILHKQVTNKKIFLILYKIKPIKKYILNLIYNKD